MKLLAASLVALLTLGQPAPPIDASQDPAVGSPTSYRDAVFALLEADLNTLRDREPVLRPVSLEIEELPAGLWGYASRNLIGGWRIVVSEAALEHEVLARETLVHEYAHILATRAGRFDEHAHGAYWGVAYSRAYRAVFASWELAALPPLSKPEDK